MKPRIPSVRAVEGVWRKTVETASSVEAGAPDWAQAQLPSVRIAEIAKLVSRIRWGHIPEALADAAANVAPKGVKSSASRVIVRYDKLLPSAWHFAVLRIRRSFTKSLSL